MKKKNIINLIKYHAEENDAGFRSEAYEIAKDFDSAGDSQLAEYIMALLSDANTFIPQMSESPSGFFEKLNVSNTPLPLPDSLEKDIIGLVNAVGRNLGINKFLFQGAPGTGKTETAKQVARILERELYSVNFSIVIDSKLGQTQKNIDSLFKEINSFAHPEKVLILFDEIDSIAMDRTNSNDLREMGRATSTILKGLDRLDDRIVLIATTNLFEHFDKALIRRFDSTIDFNRYSREDLLEIAEILMNDFLNKFKCVGRNVRLFRKIINLLDPLPYPGDLKNIIRTAIAFSNPSDGFDYLKRLYYAVNREQTANLKKLQKQGFTVREIEILTGVSKSQVSRDLKGKN
ncbi:MAG: ATP-binding protein [Spirochaetia bacterium]|jgi:SpoVK/Ycf46/Vps4 family AAA+-type ATPase|nr:ATP-binding protein [Spirochaetia bacterium]